MSTPRTFRTPTIEALIERNKLKRENRLMTDNAGTLEYKSTLFKQYVKQFIKEQDWDLYPGNIETALANGYQFTEVKSSNNTTSEPYLKKELINELVVYYLDYIDKENKHSENQRLHNLYGSIARELFSNLKKLTFKEALLREFGNTHFIKKSIDQVIDDQQLITLEDKYKLIKDIFRLKNYLQ